MSPSPFFPELQHFIQQVERVEPSAERRALLDPIIAYGRQCRDEKRTFRLQFICTHNSRRSQMAQAWAFVFAQKWQVACTTHSGGTEATACHPNTLEALRQAGFKLEMQVGANPHQLLFWAPQAQPLALWSKLYTDAANPQQGFAAVMTCTQAEESCPFIPQAEKRFPLYYDDPKAFDGSAREIEAYQACSRQIASEMNYLFKNLAQ